MCHTAAVTLPFNPGVVFSVEAARGGKKNRGMSKPAAKKSHWTSRVNECSVVKDARGELNVPLRGGAENGEFAYIGPLSEDAVACKSGKLNEGELLLEVENLSISGLPLYDVQTLIRNCKGPVRLKTVRQGKGLEDVGPSHSELRANFCCFNAVPFRGRSCKFQCTV